MPNLDLEIEEKSIEDAIKVACETLKLPREMLDIEIISRGSSGIFGIVGAKKAKIRVRPKKPSEDMIALQAKDVLEEILKYINVPAVVEPTTKNGHVWLNIISSGSGLLIGKKGQTLDAIQHLVSRIVSKKSGHSVPIVVDTENYRSRREQSLIELAKKLGERVKKSNRPITTAPMSIQDRKIIHLALKDDPYVKTKSKGEGNIKRVVIYPVKDTRVESKRRNHPSGR